MKLALECPTSTLEDIQPLADFDWILTHLVLTDEKYAEFYRQSKRYKVLDNSVNELLEPCSLENIKDAAEIVKPDVICPPDYLGDGEKTKSCLVEAMKSFGTVQLLPILQGSSMGECLSFAKLVDVSGFTQVAVPYDIMRDRNSSSLEEMTSTRVEVIKVIPNEYSFNVNLLGLTTVEELTYYRFYNVVSIDTGSPYLNGAFGRRFGRDKLLEKDVKINYNNPGSGYGYKWDDVFYNVAYLRRVISGNKL